MLGCAVWRDTSSRVVIYWNIGRSARFTFAEEVSTGQLPSPAPSYDGFVTASRRRKGARQPNFFMALQII